MGAATAGHGIYEAELAFTPSDRVGPDEARPALLRARTLEPEEQGRRESLDLRACRVRDLRALGAPALDLLRLGFDTVDLSPLTEVQRTLEGVRAAGHVTREEARAIRGGLSGASLPLSDGSRLKLLTIAPEGFIMRKAGPNGLSVRSETISEMNDHEAAGAVHADQDVKGTPLRQLMRGAAPWLFRHDTPDARNHWSPLMLLNLWIPLQQITRPLVLMDKQTLNRRAHQLRYGLPTDAFLDRDEDRRVNDIWTFLYDEGQDWYFSSEMDSHRAYVFETLSTPHGSFIVPGEEVAESRYTALELASEAVRRGDQVGLQRAADRVAEVPPPEVTTSALRRAIAAMTDLLGEADEQAPRLCRGEGAEDWLTRAGAAMDRVVRKSLEMRVVALRFPRSRPFARGV